MKRLQGITRSLGIAAAGAVLILASCAPAAVPSPAPAPPAAPAAPAARPAPPPVPPAPTPEQPRRGGILTVTAVASPAHLDVHQAASIDAIMQVAPAYSNLLYYDAQTGSKVTPELAERWEMSSDGLTYTFKLRSGTKFHDGTPLTPADVVFSLGRLKSPPKGVLSQVSQWFEPVDKIEALGEDSVRLTMKFPFTPFISALVTDRMPIYSKAYVEKRGDMKTTVMGTGPFKFKSYTPGVSLDLVRDEDYWVKGRPYLDGITFFAISDKATRLAALRTGQAKLSGRVFAALTPTDMTTLKKDISEMRFVPSPTLAGPSFFMNLRNPPLKDKRVRYAIYLAVDRQAALKVVAEGQGMVGNYFPLQGWGIPRDELLRMPGYRQPKETDIAAAKQLLAEAGYPNGFTLKVLSRNNEMTKTASVFMTDQLAQIGITATVQVLEDAVFFDTGSKGQHQVMVYTPTTNVADPHDLGKTLAPRAPFNYTGDDDDPKLSELWNKQMRTVDESQRKAVIAELERYLLIDMVPSVPIVWPATFVAVAPQVRGFVPGATDQSNNRHDETWLAP